MKKNAMLKIAAILLVAVLLTTCAISSTFAKYTTSGESTDTARVAKWGVVVDADITSLFTKTEVNSGIETVRSQGNMSVKVGDTPNVQVSDVVAPGMSGSVTINGQISGKPEVAVKVTYTPTITLTGWSVAIEDDEDKDIDAYTGIYMPLVFTVNDETYAMPGFGDPDTTITSKIVNNVDTPFATTGDLIAAVEDAIENICNSTTYAAGTELGATLGGEVTNGIAPFTFEWEWQYSTNATNDAKDTALGNLTGANIPTIDVNLDIDVTQVN